MPPSRTIPDFILLTLLYTKIPFVISGSSPLSFRTAQETDSISGLLLLYLLNSFWASAIFSVNTSFPGKDTVTWSTLTFPRSIVTAAFVAACAHVPVVYPLRSFFVIVFTLPVWNFWIHHRSLSSFYLSVWRLSNHLPLPSIVFFFQECQGFFWCQTFQYLRAEIYILWYNKISKERSHFLCQNKSSASMTP